jgi:hypothetical protein
VKFKSSQTIPHYLFTATDDAVQHEWMEQSKLDYIADLFVQDRIQIPGYAKFGFHKH